MKVEKINNNILYGGTKFSLGEARPEYIRTVCPLALVNPLQYTSQSSFIEPNSLTRRTAGWFIKRSSCYE